MPTATTTETHSAWLPRDRPVQRIARCLLGLVLFGVGIALALESDLGGFPWDVLHTGLSELTGIDVGPMIVIVGVALLALWIPLRERPGLGTVLNATVIGLVVDVVLPRIDISNALAPRVLALTAGITVVGIGSGFYIGAGLGPGPRDGLMTGLARRGVEVGRARTIIEVVVVATGMALGGEAGVGTLAFALTIGPLVAVFLPRLTVAPRPVPA